MSDYHNPACALVNEGSKCNCVPPPIIRPLDEITKLHQQIDRMKNCENCAHNPKADDCCGDCQQMVGPDFAWEMRR